MFSQKKILIERCSKKLFEKERIAAEFKMAKESEEEKCILSEKDGERE